MVHVCQSLQMCFWNIGGLISKHCNKTNDPIFMKHISMYDFVFLGETHLDPNNTFTNLGSFYSHFTHRKITKKNNRYFGGLGILIKQHLRPYVKFLQNTSPEFQWLKLEKTYFGFDRDLFICVVYYPPSGSTYTQKLEIDILNKISIDIGNIKSKGDILLCGDFNARTAVNSDFICDDDHQFIPVYHNYDTDRNMVKRKSKDPITDGRGRSLLDFCIGNQLRILNGRVLGDMHGQFTCHTPNGSSVVDYVIVSENIFENILYFKIADFIPTLSDTHCKLEWSLSAKYKLVPDKTINQIINTKQISANYIWDDNSEHYFLTALASSDIQNSLAGFHKKYENVDVIQETVDEASEDFNDIILQAADKSLRKKTPPKLKKIKSKKWFSSNLHRQRMNLISYGKIFTKFSTDPQVRSHYYKLYREYTKARKKARKEYHTSILSPLENLHEENPKMYWKLINDLKEGDSSREDRSENCIDSNTWLNHFQNLSKTREIYSERLNILQKDLEELESTKIFNALDFPIKQSEISQAIAKLKHNKSSGLDKISNSMLKCGQHVLLYSLIRLFNMVLSSGKYPKAWSCGYISTIHKGGDKNDPNNYRGITVTGAIGKIFNSVLNNRLDTFLVENNIIDNCQIGFTKKARTSDHMFILKCLFDKYCNEKNGKLYACFVDFHKAFDTVIHTGIKIKLLQIEVGQKFYNIVKEMYRRSISCIKIHNQITDFFQIEQGVRQGDNLSPNLFKIFLNDLPKYMDGSIDSVTLNNHIIHCLMYADDLILLASSPNGLQSKLDILDKYCNDWCLNVNLSKTKVMVFNKPGKKLSGNFSIHNKCIECVQQYKYLGVYFCNSGSFTMAQNELYKKALKACSKLQREITSKYHNVNINLHLFDHTIAPILLYGCEIWGCFNPLASKFKDKDVTMNKIFNKLKCETLHIKFCKSILGVQKKSSNFAVLSELGRFPLYYQIIKTMLNYWFRLETLQNPSLILLKEAYLVSKNLYLQNKPSWFASIQAILDQLSKFKILIYQNKVLVHLRRNYQILQDIIL